jgi:chromosome segregation ATPase
VDVELIRLQGAVKSLTRDINELERSHARTDTAVGKLNEVVPELKRKVEPLVGNDTRTSFKAVLRRLGELETRLGEHSLDDLSEQVTAIRSDLGALSRRADAMARLLNSVNGRLGAYERRDRFADEIPQADLDALAVEHDPLYPTIRLAHALPVELAGVEQLRTSAEEADQRLKACFERVARMRELARGMGFLEATDGRGWRRAERSWATVRKRAAEGPDLVRAIEESKQAHVRLTAALERDRNISVQSEQGEQAWTKLVALLRERLDDALVANLRLPRWFENRLGPGEPRQDLEEWRDTAAQVLAYRFAHGVTDQVNALGSRPGEPTARRALYDRLDERCGAVGY